MSERFAILNPCAKRWTDLSGEGRKRFCDECQTYVHALDQYSVQEFEELKRESGRVCGFLAGESLPEPRSRAILIGAFLTAISPLMAQSGRIRIRVTDVTGAVIPGAEVALLGMDGNALRTENANERGEFIFSDLPIGNSRLRVSRRGFYSKPVTITLQNSEEVTLQVKLEVGSQGGAVRVEGHIEPPAELPHPLTLPAPKMVTVPPPDVTSPQVEVELPLHPKRRWWQIFR